MYDASCMHRAIIAAQEVHTGREALDLLRHSQRVEADLVVGQISNAGDASSQIVLRRWDPRINPLCEVRAFVCDGRVTAITQYYRTCLVPALLANAERVRQLVCEAVTGVHERLKDIVPDDPLCHAPFYSADFALVGGDADSETSPSVSSQEAIRSAARGFDSALLIEINPPPPVAGTILFDWSDTGDRDLLMGKCAHKACHGPVLRLVESPVPWSSIPFHPPLKQFVDSLRGRRLRASLLPRCCCRRKTLHLD